MPRDLQYLYDILQAARLAFSYVRGKSRKEFDEDIQCQDAVIRRLEIIGEAARRISASTKAEYRDLDWQDMIGMRNHMTHRYDEIDLKIVWDTAQKNLPILIDTLEKIFPPDSKKQ